MKRPIGFVICILLGLGLGWYFGLIHQQKLLRQYQAENLKKSEPTEGFAAGIALVAYEKLEAGDTDTAKRRLATTISIYYRTHRLDGSPKLLALIETYAATNAAISNAIYAKSE
jgi:hypothetical protein